MKIVSINIRHGGGERVEQLVEYLLAQTANVIVLTEFRDNKNSKKFRRAFNSEGYKYSTSACKDSKTNSVCIFSKIPFKTKTLSNLNVENAHRLVSVIIDDLELSGVYFSQKKAKEYLFNYLIENKHQPTAKKQLIIGDFNTGIHYIDEKEKSFHCAKSFKKLCTTEMIDAWRTRNPETKEYSWYSQKQNGFRIDHAIVNQELDKYIAKVNYCHIPRESKITDHSALIVQIV